jgi:hypothetical protein
VSWTVSPANELKRNQEREAERRERNEEQEKQAAFRAKVSGSASFQNSGREHTLKSVIVYPFCCSVFEEKLVIQVSKSLKWLDLTT